MAPGYFFVSPYMNMQPGVYIYDNNAVSTPYWILVPRLPPLLSAYSP